MYQPECHSLWCVHQAQTVGTFNTTSVPGNIEYITSDLTAKSTKNLNGKTTILPESCVILEAGKQFWVENDFLEFNVVFVTTVKPRQSVIMIVLFMFTFAFQPFMHIAYMMQ